jgi:hypothetical protein
MLTAGKAILAWNSALCLPEIKLTLIYLLRVQHMALYVLVLLFLHLRINIKVYTFHRHQTGSTHRYRALLKNLIIEKTVKKFPTLVKSKGPLLCLKEPATGPLLGSVQSISYKYSISFRSILMLSSHKHIPQYVTCFFLLFYSFV